MLSLQIFTTPTSNVLLADFTSRLHPPFGGGMRFSTNEHGFAVLDVPLVPLSLEEAFLVYDWPETPHMVVSDEGANVVWEGRLEDAGIVPGGIRLGGMGYWRAFRDAPYTALWSDDSYALWRPITDDATTLAFNQKFEVDNNNRIYIAAKKNEGFINGERGAVGYAIPFNSARPITRVEFNYEQFGTSSWAGQLTRYTTAPSFDSSWTFGATEWVQAGNGTTQTGSQNITLGADAEGLIFFFYYSPGTRATYSGETGDYYLKITGLRVTTDDGNVYGDEIIADIVDVFSTLNSTQLSSSTAAIDSPALDLANEIYEEADAASVATRLAALGDGTNLWEVGVDVGQTVYFRERGTKSKEWYVDVTQILNMERSLEPLRNSVYAKYKDGTGATLRTDNADDAASQARFGIVRRGVIDVQTTSSTEAETHRDTYLSDLKNLSIRAGIEFTRLYDQTGAEYPLWAIKAGDTLTMRNLSPSLTTDIDNIRTFYVGGTEYDSASNTISVSPEEPIPTLDVLIARRDARFEPSPQPTQARWSITRLG